LRRRVVDAIAGRGAPAGDPRPAERAVAVVDQQRRRDPRHAGSVARRSAARAACAMIRSRSRRGTALTPPGRPDGPTEWYEVKPAIRAHAAVASMEEYQRLYRLSLDNPEWFWGEQAKILDWFHPWHAVFDADYDAVDFSWYLGGRLNACFNCVDRHL